MPSLRFYTIVCSLTAMAAAAAALAASAGDPGAVETLRSVTAVPPHIVGALAEPAAFAAIPNGELVVFDRRGHTLVAVDREMRAARPIVQIGGEPGRILQPFGFDVDSQGLLIVGDAPDRQERVQVFTATGSRLAGFWLPHRDEPRIQFEGIALNGVSSLHATPRQTVLLSMPHTGALFAEYDYDGGEVRTIGRLRATPHDDDARVRLALNSGLPLAIPSGGYYFVFQTGEPRFRRYDAMGRLMYERVIQGRELDQWIARSRRRGRRPRRVTRNRCRWCRSSCATPPSIAQESLWISLSVPFTYVYDASGEKRRTVQFRGAGEIRPSHLSFAADGRLLVTPGCYIFRRPKLKIGAATMPLTADQSSPSPTPTRCFLRGAHQPRSGGDGAPVVSGRMGGVRASGLGPIRGWDAVRESWGVLFAAAGRSWWPRRTCRFASSAMSPG